MRPGLALGVLVGVLAVAGCGGGSAGDGRPTVVAAFYPLACAAERVAGDRYPVVDLTPPGAEPHDVELSPAQVSHLDTADLVVYLSGFQAAVDDAVAQTAPAHVLDAADVTPLMSDEGHEHEYEEGDESALHRRHGSVPVLQASTTRRAAEHHARPCPARQVGRRRP